MVGCKIYGNLAEMDRIDTIAKEQPAHFPLEIGFCNKEGNYGLSSEFIGIIEDKFRNFPNKIAHLSIKNTLFSYDKKQDAWKKRARIRNK